MLLILLGSACAPDDEPRTTSASKKTDRRAARDPVKPACGEFDDEYRAAFKACDADADCEAVPVQVSCAGTYRVFGVASADLEGFLDCTPYYGLELCPGQALPTRAEDGRVSSNEKRDDVEARCVEGKCQTHVATRPCGTNGKICNGGDLCVSSQGSAGALEYECIANPCAGKPLDCKCAEPVCQQGAGEAKMCAVDRVTESDVFCKAVRL
jgi:hypothetical protein